MQWFDTRLKAHTAGFKVRFSFHPKANRAIYSFKLQPNTASQIIVSNICHAALDAASRFDSVCYLIFLIGLLYLIFRLKFICVTNLSVKVYLKAKPPRLRWFIYTALIKFTDKLDTVLVPISDFTLDIFTRST